MKKGYCHVSVVLDRSGSMSSMASEVVGGINNLIDEQNKVKGEATFTLVQFDDQYETVNDFTPIKDVPAFEKFNPRGCTALLDAMGKTMNNVREKIEAMAEADRPAKALFVFITDGEENASKKYARTRVFQMITDLKEAKEGQTSYDFVFIGANQDAIAEGGSVGIRAAASLTFDASGDGATHAFYSLSRGMTSYRGAPAAACYAFSAEDYKVQDDLKKGDKKDDTKAKLDAAFRDKKAKYNKAIPDSISDL